MVALLTDFGFLFGDPQTVTTTLVDTFDGRLRRAGLRLELRKSEQLELVLSGDDIVPARLTVERAPSVLADLPRGPFRSRIAELIDVRALAPRLRVRMNCSTGVWRDSTDKAVSIAELNEGARVLGRPDGERATTIEIHEVPGYAKQAVRVREVLAGVGLVEQDHDTLERCAVESGVDLAGFKGSATVPLDPQMAAIDGFRAVFANLAVAISANWQGAIDQIDPKFLHDLRIALRRTRTVLRAATSVVPTDVSTAAAEGFAWLAGATGPSRDLDVYLLEWEHYTGPLGPEAVSALAPVRDLLEQRCRDAHLELEQTLQSDRAVELITEWRAWLTEPLDRADLPRRAERPLGKVVAKRIDRAHSALVEAGRMIDPDTPAEQVHELRKDAKKLRYLIECFGSLLPDKPRKRYVKHLKALQENLGEHQDAEVHIALLRSLTPELETAGAGADTMVAIGQLTERLNQTRIASRAEFAERFADYDSHRTQQALDAALDAISS